MRITIPLANDDMQPDDDLVRLIGFASEKIVSIEREQSALQVQLEEGADVEAAYSKIERIIKHRSSASQQQTVIYSTGDANRTSFTTEFPNHLVKNYGDGLIGLEGDAIRLFDYFDSKFKQFALDLTATEKHYPTLLPLAAMDKTGYLRTSPQYSMFVCHPKEDVDELLRMSREAMQGSVKDVVHEPNYVLSPAACFHCYTDLEQAELEKPEVYTFRQKVFRHEGRLNWSGFGRLRDYNVREIVFIGDEPFVHVNRNYVLDKVKRFVSELNLTARVCVTSDPFVVPSMQKFKKIQLEEESKLELQLAYGLDRYLAVASFNLHGTAFTNPFDIRIHDKPQSVTGCVGFGLERWVLAFLAQHGIDPRRWESII